MVSYSLADTGTAGGMWGSAGTYTWRGDTCHVTHDTCHESSDRSDEWVDIDSGKIHICDVTSDIDPEKESLLGPEYTEYNVMPR